MVVRDLQNYRYRICNHDRKQELTLIRETVYKDTIFNPYQVKLGIFYLLLYINILVKIIINKNYQESLYIYF